ncbi:MAG: hypothetical protein QOE61_2807, partial [Micromonosporaceae bacterium]|nr:hypothetical protein [Micromonosporaceae bacterium]
VYTNVVHSGGRAGLVFGAASAITMVLWFVKLRDDYRHFQRHTGQATRPRPKLGPLWLVAPRLSTRAWIVATRRRISTVDEGAIGAAPAGPGHTPQVPGSDRPATPMGNNVAIVSGGAHTAPASLRDRVHAFLDSQYRVDGEIDIWDVDDPNLLWSTADSLGVSVDAVAEHVRRPRVDVGNAAYEVQLPRRGAVDIRRTLPMLSHMPVVADSLAAGRAVSGRLVSSVF